MRHLRLRKPGHLPASILRRRIEGAPARAVILRAAGIAALVSAAMVGIGLVPAILEPARTALFMGIVTLLLFWGTADHAQALVREVSVGTADSALYRYDGLRLLVLSGGRYFFLHAGWTLQTGTVVVLPDDNSVRIEFKR